MLTRRSFLKFLGLGAAAPIVAKAAPSLGERSLEDLVISFDAETEMALAINPKSMVIPAQNILHVVAGSQIDPFDLVVLRGDGLVYPAGRQDFEDGALAMAAMEGAKPGDALQVARSGSLFVAHHNPEVL